MTRHGRALTSYYARWIAHDLSRWQETLISRVSVSTPESHIPFFPSLTRADRLGLQSQNRAVPGHRRQCVRVVGP